MRGFLPATVVALGLSPLFAGGAFAAPVAGYETLYDALLTSCSLPTGTVPDCESAINAYSSPLVSGGVSLEQANLSFSSARQTVYAANESDKGFQAEIDALFERLLPESGAVTAPPAGIIAPGSSLDPISATTPSPV